MEAAIKVPQDKASALQALSKLSPKALNKLADKLKYADEKRIADIEKKIDTYSVFI